MPVRGRFITIEGMEGVGKTTNIQIVESILQRRDITFLTTREPGGTPLAEQIRRLLLDDGTEAMEPMTELLLMFAARTQHVRQFIEPALANGTWVICDRFTDSTYAYQGAGRGIDAAAIARLEEVALGGFEPDLTLVLDLSPEVGLARAQRRGEPDRFEQEGIDFFRRVRDNYLARAGVNPRMKVVDAEADLETVGRQINDILAAELGP